MGEDSVTGQMATWREWRAWRREFKSLGIRQVKEREAHSIWHEEKQQAARWWLREQELLPYVLAALALKEREAHSIWHVEKQQAARWWLREQVLVTYVLAVIATLSVGLIAWLKITRS